MYCTNCGAENDDNMNFCKMCGTPLIKEDIWEEESMEQELEYQQEQQFTYEQQNQQSAYQGQSQQSAYEQQNQQSAYQGQRRQSAYEQQNQESAYQGQNQQYTYQEQPRRPFWQEHVENMPEEYQPVSALGYFAFTILFSLPVIGLIVLCIYAFGNTQNRNLRNYARSYFYVAALVLLLCILFFSSCVAGLSAIARF